MKTRALGGSGLNITPIIFGAWAIGGWRWGGGVESESIAAIQESIDQGINAIDTAPVYGMGYSEELVGRAIKGRRERVLIATKGGRSWFTEQGSMPVETTDPAGKKLTLRSNSRREVLMKECEDSLRRLQVDVIDLYQIHWPDLTIPIEDGIETLTLLKKQGKIRAIGVSNFNAEQLRAVTKIAQVDSLQPPYSLLQRQIEEEILPVCLEHNLGVIVYSPMERGLLTGAVGADRVFPSDDHRNTLAFFSQENRRRVLAALEQVKPIADKHRASFAQIVINWTVSQPGITGAIVGARNPDQARHNAHALRFKLSPEELATMSEVFERCSKEMRAA